MALMVEAAPVFGEIASAAARRIDGATLVAHNLPFDTRMLACELERLGAAFDGGSGLRTPRATGDKLSIACARFGTTMNLQHRAPTDALATAQLAGQFAADIWHDARGATVGYIADTPSPRTLRRAVTGIASAIWPTSSPTHTTRIPSKPCSSTSMHSTGCSTIAISTSGSTTRSLRWPTTSECSARSAVKRAARTWCRSSLRRTAMVSSPQRSSA